MVGADSQNHVFAQARNQPAHVAVHDAQGVVDEVMRYSPAIFGTARNTGEDVELLGVEIPAGTLVSVNTAADLERARAMANVPE